VYFVSPYFHHDAFMHHPMYVLDAPASSEECVLIATQPIIVHTELQTSGTYVSNGWKIGNR